MVTTGTGIKGTVSAGYSAIPNHSRSQHGYSDVAFWSSRTRYRRRNGNVCSLILDCDSLLTLRQRIYDCQSLCCKRSQGIHHWAQAGCPRTSCGVGHWCPRIRCPVSRCSLPMMSAPDVPTGSRWMSQTKKVSRPASNTLKESMASSISLSTSSSTAPYSNHKLMPSS